MALNEWGLQASVLNDEWTPELLWLMFRERSREIARTRRAQRNAGNDSNNPAPEPRRVVSDMQMFKMPGIHYVPPQAKKA